MAGSIQVLLRCSCREVLVLFLLKRGKITVEQSPDNQKLPWKSISIAEVVSPIATSTFRLTTAQASLGESLAAIASKKERIKTCRQKPPWPRMTATLHHAPHSPLPLCPSRLPTHLLNHSIHPLRYHPHPRRKAPDHPRHTYRLPHLP